jgi:hypothetical protein
MMRKDERLKMKDEVTPLLMAFASLSAMVPPSFISHLSSLPE